MGKLELRGLVRQVSPLKSGRHLVQEVESLRKVPKFKFVNKSDICVNFKLDSTNHESDFGPLDPGDQGKLKRRVFQS